MQLRAQPLVELLTTCAIGLGEPFKMIASGTPASFSRCSMDAPKHELMSTLL